MKKADLEGFTRPQLMVKYPKCGLKAHDRKDAMIEKILASEKPVSTGRSTGVRNTEPPSGNY